MNTLKRSNKNFSSFQVSIFFFILIPLLLGQGCSPSPIVEPTSKDVAPTTPTKTPAHFLEPTPTSTPEIKKDTIYFWWVYSEKSELWRLEPNGNSSIVHTTNLYNSFEVVLNNGLLSEEGIKALQETKTTNPDKNDDNLPVRIFPVSLSLSPDKNKLAWEEIISYCPPGDSGFDFCIGESAIRVFDLNQNRLQIIQDTQAFSANTYKPLWSYDSRYIAFMGEGGIVKVIDMETDSVQEVGRGREFCWYPDEHKIVFESFDGVQVYNVRTKQTTPVPTNPGDILQVAISPNGITLAYTHFDPPSRDVMYAIDLNTGENKPVIKWNDGLWLYNVQWLSSDLILYTQQKSYPEPFHIYIRDVQTGAIVLDKKIPLDILPNNSAILSKDATKILFVGFDHKIRLTLVIYDIVADDWFYVPLPQTIQKVISTLANKSWDYQSLRNAVW